MLWAQITILVMYGVSLLLFARDHGKPKTGNDNFWMALASLNLMFWLTYFAGGFDRIF